MTENQNLPSNKHENKFEYDYDYVVIGSGPGGQNAAIQAANAGKKVALIEKEQKVGGHCVYNGTIPSKTLREAAIAVFKMKKYSNVFDFKIREETEVQSLLTRLDEVLSSHNTLISNQIANSNIDLYHGKASFIDKNHIEIYNLDGSKIVLSTNYVIISTGSSPRVPTDMFVDHEHILDSDSILNLLYIPQSMVVLGGGVIACEYASTFALLGTKVTILDRLERPLAFMDKELTDRYVEEFETFGGRYYGNQKYKSVIWDGVSEVKIELENGETLNAEKVLFALGRLANIDKLKLHNVGIEINDRNLIVVDTNYKTNIDNIYAVGDVIGFPALASTSMEQGRLAIMHTLELDSANSTDATNSINSSKNSFNNLPFGIYAVPELASIGLSEEEAIQKYGQVYVGRADFREVARAQISGMNNGLLKIITDVELNIIGVHIVGGYATELIHMAEMAINHNCKVNVFLENIMNFPTMAEAYRIATLNIISKYNNLKITT